METGKITIGRWQVTDSTAESITLHHKAWTVDFYMQEHELCVDVYGGRYGDKHVSVMWSVFTGKLEEASRLTELPGNVIHSLRESFHNPRLSIYRRLRVAWEDHYYNAANSYSPFVPLHEGKPVTPGRALYGLLMDQALI